MIIVGFFAKKFTELITFSFAGAFSVSLLILFAGYIGEPSFYKSGEGGVVIFLIRLITIFICLFCFVGTIQTLKLRINKFII